VATCASKPAVAARYSRDLPLVCIPRTQAPPTSKPIRAMAVTDWAGVTRMGENPNRAAMILDVAGNVNASSVSCISHAMKSEPAEVRMSTGVLFTGESYCATGATRGRTILAVRAN